MPSASKLIHQRRDSSQSITNPTELFQRIDRRIEELLPPVGAPSQRLHQAMHHAVAGGKRLRPRFLMLVADACCGGDWEEGTCELAVLSACAVEFIHAASLVHDDLPSFDNSPLRRGQPTVHVLFGEPLAILAGDALIALAFDSVSQAPLHLAQRATRILKRLAMALGNQGLCGGQSLEFEVSHALLGAAEGGPAAVLTREYVESCHSMKTASLFAMAAEAGALAVGAPRPEAFGRIGHKLGLAFQLADDLIDACGHQQEAGKPVQRDHVLGRPNAVLAVGEESVRKQARALLADAWASLRAELKESTLLDAWLGDLIASLVPGSAR